MIMLITMINKQPLQLTKLGENKFNMKNL